MFFREPGPDIKNRPCYWEPDPITGNPAIFLVDLSIDMLFMEEKKKLSSPSSSQIPNQHHLEHFCVLM